MAGPKVSIGLIAAVVATSLILLFQNCGPQITPLHTDRERVELENIHMQTAADSSSSGEFQFAKTSLAIGIYHPHLQKYPIAYSGQYLKHPSSVVSIEVRHGSLVEKIQIANSQQTVFYRPDRVEFLITPSLSSPDKTTIQLAFANATKSPVIPVHFYTVGQKKPDAAAANAFPLLLKQDSSGKLLVHNEFSSTFRTFDPASSKWTTTTFPVPHGIKPFSYFDLSRGVESSQNFSVNAEGGEVDSRGNYWLSQGGGFPFGTGDLLNIARVVKYNPAAKSWKLYNLPGNNRGVYGINYDETRERLWYTAGRSQRGSQIARSAVIGHFAPTQVPSDLLQNPVSTATCIGGSATKVGQCSNNQAVACFVKQDCSNAHRICSPNYSSTSSSSACYSEYAVPGVVAGHIHVDAIGDAWFTGFWEGNYLGRISAATKKVFIYPLPAPRGESLPVSSTQSGPWEILEDAQGRIVFVEYFDSTITRFDPARKDDPLCLALDSKGKSPCLAEFDIPGANLAKHFPHTMAKEKSGRIWFTHSSFSGHGQDPLVEATIGVTTPDLTQIYMFSGLKRLPKMEGHTGGAGIVVDRSSDDIIWFNDYEGAQLIKLVRVR